MSSDLRSRTVWRNFLSWFVDVCCITGSEIKRPCSHVARDPSFFWIAGLPPIALGVEAVEILLEPPAESRGHLA